MTRREPVWQTYPRDVIERPCPTCGARPGVWCTNEITGRVRRVPCIDRLTEGDT